MRRLLFVFACAALSLGAQEKTPAPAATPALPDGLYAEFTTPHGTFVAELFYQKTPMTVASFVGRAETGIAAREGKPFFSGLTWYRVVPNFVIQSGDPIRSAAKPDAKPADGDDAAGHPFPFPDEIAPGLHHESAGILSMANGGPDTNSSEFFITLRDTNRLNFLHSVFGRVVRGVELLPQIKQDEGFTIKILRLGAAARAFKADQIAFAAHIDAAKKYSFAVDPGPTAHFDDPDHVLPTEPPRAKYFNFKLANFERFTGKKIYARIFKTFTPTHDGQKLGAFHAELAEKLGVKNDGVLVSYFADLDTWMLWIGEPLLPAFMGRAGSREEFLSRDGLMQRKQSFFADAKKRGADFAAQAIAEGRTVNDAQRLKLVVDEVVDGLIMIYEPKSP
jgi:cyclophilin family peptidyl-prolyl cis-trans isomerase